MVFSSSIFLFGFLPLILFIYYLADNRWRNFILLLGSLLFYAWGEPQNIFIMLLSIVLNYIMGLLIQETKLKKTFMLIAVIYNVGTLFVFKYLNFSVSILGLITKREIGFKEIILPIGISFYTFQILSYIVDVFREKVPAQKSLINLALYVALFPQLIAGPIVRYVDVEKQIKSRTIDWNGLYIGTRRFMFGIAKKILLADQLSTLADVAFERAYPSIFLSWIGILAYTLQIYFDFSGYSDMAIGLGKMFGFDFLENFNYPYISQSIQEFWRRWHISLSSWFRDYVYIPLGGSRNGNIRTYINLFVVFFLTGLWHGASFNFIVWGLFYAVFLIFERLGFKNILEKMPKVIRHIYTVLIIMIGWVFFRADNLMAAFDYLRSMLISSGKDRIYFNFIMNNQYWFCLFAGIICAVPHTRLKKLIKKCTFLEYICNFILLFVFILSICYMVGSGYSPFLYFRF